MRRLWIGIRISAALLALGGVAMLLVAAAVWWVVLYAPSTAVQEAPPPKALVVALAAFFAVLGLWAVATAIGVLRRREWARVSTVIMAVLLAAMGGSAVLGILFVRLPESQAVPARTMANIRVAIAAFYGAMALVGGWWLLLFNSGDARLYFAERNPAPGAPARPLSISIIAWYLLLFSLATAAAAMLRIPAMVFGAVVTSWGALAVYTVFTAVQIYLGTGLWQLQNPARIGSIVYFSLAMANSALAAGLPGFETRFQLMLQALPHFLRPISAPGMIAETWVLAILASVLGAAPIWFLARRRQAFL